MDDSADDAELTRRTFIRCRVENPIIVFATGYDALGYMKGTGGYGNREEYPLPVLTLLDLRLPGLKGPEVLSAMQSEIISSLCPVVILSGDTDLKEVQLTYKLGAASFLIKPVSVPDVMNLLQNLPRLSLSESADGGLEITCD